MSICKVKEEDFKELAEIYNEKGKQSLYELLNTKYAVKYPYYIFKRMCTHSGLAYDSEKDVFMDNGSPSSRNLFLSMEELCTPMIPQHVSTKEQSKMDSRPAAMDKLIRELIGDRLLELSKYVTIDSLSKRVIVDKTTLIDDGYQLIII